VTKLVPEVPQIATKGFTDILQARFASGGLISGSGQFSLSAQGGNSQNFLHKFIIFFLTLRCFYKAIIHRKSVIYVFYSS